MEGAERAEGAEGQRAQRALRALRLQEGKEGKLCMGMQRAQRLQRVQRVQRLQRAPRAHVEALAQLRPYTAVGLLRQVIPRACGRLAEAVLGRGAQHKHRHARCLGPGAERV